jgi:hypothetical protein
VIFSCFFHHSFGSPVPARVDGIPFGKPSVVPPNTALFGTFVNRGFEVHGSSDEYAGSGARMVWLLCFLGLCVVGAIVDTDGWSWSRSRLGSGKVFCDESAATCSMLTSRTGDKENKQINHGESDLCPTVQAQLEQGRQRTQALIPEDVS